jgi:hypothetical protein
MTGIQKNHLTKAEASSVVYFSQKGIENTGGLRAPRFFLQLHLRITQHTNWEI